MISALSRDTVGVFDAARLGDVHRPLAGDASGPRREQDDPLPEPHRLAHVVRDEDDGSAGLRPDAGELLVQHVPRDGVERRERLVHEQEVALLGQRAGQGDALPHAARQLVHPLGAGALEPDEREQALGLLASLRAGDAPQPQRELDVPRSGEPRVERGLLEHQRRPAARHLDGAGDGLVQPRDQGQQGRLAAAGRAEQADELARRHGQVDAVEHRGSRRLAEVVRHPGQARRDGGRGRGALAADRRHGGGHLPDAPRPPSETGSWSFSASTSLSRVRS